MRGCGFKAYESELGEANGPEYSALNYHYLKYVVERTEKTRSLMDRIRTGQQAATDATRCAANNLLQHCLATAGRHAEEVAKKKGGGRSGAGCTCNMYMCCMSI